jgi:hypothetical protein
MSLDPVRLESAITRNDVREVRALLRDATEPDRRACASQLRSLLRGPDLSALQVTYQGPELTGPQDLPALVAFVFDHVARDQRDGRYAAADRAREQWHATRNKPAFLAASLGLAGGVAAAHIAADRCDPWCQPGSDDLDAIAGVLADRRPPWLAELVRRKLRDRADFGLGSWNLARTLIRLGAIERPDLPEYTTKMPGALCHRMRGGAGLGDWFVRHPLTGLLDDPGLLEDEVWRLFTVPDAALMLAAGDGRWEDALVTLAERGRLDRDRLLDACLDAFTMDFAPGRVGWYVTFHDRMGPSLSEMAARAGQYLRLLATGAKPGLSLGQKACGRLLEAGLLAPEDLLAASGPALLFPLKSVAAAQLKLIAKVAAAQTPLTDRALASAAVAFGHERLDIQEAALKLIARWGLPEDEPERGTITELAASLAPALAREAAALGLPDRSGPVHVEVPAPGPAGDELLPPPLDDPDELVQLLTQLMEDASDALALERAVAGAVRLCVLPVGERARLAGPLLKRAERRLREDYDGPFSGHEITADVAALTLAWATGQVPDTGAAVRPYGSEDRETVLRSGRAKIMAGVLTARIWEACTLVAEGSPARLLAEPESGSGAIGPDRLLGRLRSWVGRDLPRYDLETALLRLAPGMDDAFWSAWSAAHPASLPAARHAYRQGHTPLGFEPQIGLPSRPWWRNSLSEAPVVVARILPPPDDADRGTGSTGSHSWALLTALDRPLRDFYRDYGERWYIGASYQALVAGWPLLCPWQPELAAAHLLRPLSDGLQRGSTWVGTAAMAVSGLSVAGRRLGQIGHLALLTGLASAEPYARIAAAEVWAKAALDGRLDPQMAADAIVMGVVGRAFKLNRVAEAIEYASHEQAAGQQIVAMVFAAADRLIPARPANLHLLLEIAARIGATTGIPEPPDAITRIAAAKGSTRLAAAARQISPRH